MRNFILFAGLVCLLTGCGSTGNTVTGKVTLDDGSTAPRGTVSLMGEGLSFRGAIGSDGTYVIEGVEPGTYSVAVTGVTAEEVDSQAGMEYDDEKGEYIGEAAEPPKSLIKDIYFNPTTSGLTITVPSESYDLQLETADGATSSGTEEADGAEGT
jgi:hypothetical protein